MAVSKEDAIKELARRELQRRSEVRRAEIKAKDAKDFDPTAEMEGLEKFLVGNTAGFIDAGRRATNLLLPESLTPDWASDEEIQKQAEIDAPLERTGAGLAGKILGGAAATAPAGGAAGTGLRALAATSRAVRAAPVLSRALGSTPARATLEGAVEGAILANPEDRLGGGGLGAGLGGGLSAAGGALGGLGRALGRATRVDITSEAKQLQKIMSRFAEEPGDEFIPLSQSAKPGLGKQLYEGLISNIPGGGQKLRAQYERALDTFRETAMAKSLPHGKNISTVFRRGDDIQTGFSRMAEAWEDTFRQANNLKFKVPPNLVPKGVRDVIDALPGSSYSMPAPGVWKGRDLVDLKEVIQKAISSQPKGMVGKTARDKLIRVRDKVETMIMAGLRRGGRAGRVSKTAARGRAFDQANYQNWRKLREAAVSAGGDAMFTPRQLLKSASKGREAAAFGTGGRLQELGKLGKSALSPFPSRQGIFQTVAALGVLGSGVGGAYLSPENPIMGGAVGLGLPILASKGLASRGFQKAISGQSNARKLRAMINALRASGMPARQAAVAAQAIMNRENQDAS